MIDKVRCCTIQLFELVCKRTFVITGLPKNNIPAEEKERQDIEELKHQRGENETIKSTASRSILPTKRNHEGGERKAERKTGDRRKTNILKIRIHSPGMRRKSVEGNNH